MTPLPPWMEEIRERASHATNGKWTAREVGCGVGYSVFSENNNILSLHNRVPMFSSLDDVEFIAHAPTDISKLLEACRVMYEALELINRGGCYHCEDDGQGRAR